jgi:hypothetical protein
MNRTKTISVIASSSVLKKVVIVMLLLLVASGSFTQDWDGRPDSLR